MELRPGDEFAGHRIEGVAGRGGMGVVYRATALDLERLVALKLVAGHLALDPVFRERFIRETRTAASIDHPNVIPVFYAGEADERLYIAMRYVEGDDLRELIRREVRLTPGRAAGIVAQIGSALDAAHARGIVHRDVKPGNVLIGGDDHAYLTDFGLTKRVNSAPGGSTRAGDWVGTLGYVAPEQIRGGQIDARTDVYALGSVLFHALTGSMPYNHDSDEATLWAHLHDPPPLISPGAPDVPPAFQAVIERAMAKDPADRYPSAGDLGRATLAAAGQGPVPDRTDEHPVATGGAALAPDPRTQAQAESAETRVSPTLLASEQATRQAAVADGTRVAERGAEPLGRRPGRGGPSRDTVRRRRRLAGAGAVGLALVLMLAGLYALGDEGPTASTTSATGTSGSTSTGPKPTVAPAGRLTKKIPVGFAPEQVNVAAGKVWVAATDRSRLTLIDAETNKKLPGGPDVGAGTGVLASGYNSMWVGKQGTRTVLRYDATTLKRVGGAAVLPPGAVVALATGDGGVWAANAPTADGKDGQTITKILPDTMLTAPAEIPTPDGVQDAAEGFGAVWVIGRSQPYITRIDVGTARAQRITVGGRPQHVALGGGFVWVTNKDRTVERVSPASLRVDQRVALPKIRPGAVAVGDNGVWVADLAGGTITRIDPPTGRVIGDPIPVGKRPINLIVRSQRVWVALKGENAIARVDFDPVPGAPSAKG